MILNDVLYTGNIPMPSDTLYRYTLRLLKHYRSYHWQLKVFTCRASGLTEIPKPTELPKPVESSNPAESSRLAENGSYLDHEQEQLWKQISFLSDYLSAIDHLTDLIRSHHPHGEQYYWILYYTYLSPAKPECTDSILDLLADQGCPIPRRTYFRKRKDAIETLAILVGQFFPSSGISGRPEAICRST